MAGGYNLAGGNNPFKGTVRSQSFWPNARPTFERESVALLKDLVCPVCTATLTSPIYDPRPKRIGLSRPTKRRGLEGLIVKLPPKQDIPSWSIVAGGQQPSVNDGTNGNAGAWDHPAVITAVSGCKCLVYCSPATSFGGRTIQEKYEGCSNKTVRRETFRRYLALEKPGTVPHNGWEAVLKHDGPPMPEQTYVHLDYGYWIEVRNLQVFPGNERRLGNASLQLLDSRLERLEEYRAKHGRRVQDPSSPPASSTASPASSQASPSSLPPTPPPSPAKMSPVLPSPPQVSPAVTSPAQVPPPVVSPPQKMVPAGPAAPKAAPRLYLAPRGAASSTNWRLDREKSGSSEAKSVPSWKSAGSWRTGGPPIPSS